MGPWLVSADEIEDPHSLDISTTLNGERVQNSNTRELIFKIPETIEFLSSVMTLQPGDIVLTGTPSGVGFSHKPPKWLTPGAESRGPRGRPGRIAQHLCRGNLSRPTGC